MIKLPDLQICPHHLLYSFCTRLLRWKTVSEEWAHHRFIMIICFIICHSHDFLIVQYRWGVYRLSQKSFVFNIGHGTKDASDYWWWWRTRTWKETRVDYAWTFTRLFYTWNLAQKQLWVHTGSDTIVLEGLFTYKWINLCCVFPSKEFKLFFGGFWVDLV